MVTQIKGHLPVIQTRTKADDQQVWNGDRVRLPGFGGENYSGNGFGGWDHTTRAIFTKLKYETAFRSAWFWLCHTWKLHRFFLFGFHSSEAHISAPVWSKKMISPQLICSLNGNGNYEKNGCTGEEMAAHFCVWSFSWRNENMDGIKPNIASCERTDVKTSDKFNPEGSEKAITRSRHQFRSSSRPTSYYKKNNQGQSRYKLTGRVKCEIVSNLDSQLDFPNL